MAEPRALISRDLVTLSGSFFFVFMGAASIQQYLIPYLAEQTGRTHAECSWVLATVYLSSIFWRILCAYTLDFFGARRSIILGQITYTLFATSVFLTNVYPALIVAAIVWGWGAAAIWITGPTQILETTSGTRYGSASGIFYASVHAGQGIGVYILGRLLSDRGADEMLIVAICITLIGNFSSLFLPDKKVHRDPPRVRDVLRVLSTRKSRTLAFILFVSSIGFGIVLSTFSSLVAESVRIEFWVVLGFYGARLFASWYGGSISDRLGRHQVLVFGFLTAAFGLTLAAFSKSPIVLLLTSMTLGLQMGIVPVSAMALIGDSTESGRRHLAFGAIYVWSNLGVGLTIVFGQYLRILLGGLSACFAVFAAAFALCALLSMDLGRRAAEKF